MAESPFKVLVVEKDATDSRMMWGELINPETMPSPYNSTDAHKNETLLRLARSEAAPDKREEDVKSYAKKSGVPVMVLSEQQNASDRKGAAADPVTAWIPDRFRGGDKSPPVRVPASHGGREVASFERGRPSALMEAIGEGIVMIDTRARVTYMNATAEELVGRARDQAKHRPLSEVFRFADDGMQASFHDTIREVLSPGDDAPSAPIISSRPLVLITENGATHVVDVRYIPLCNRHPDEGAALVLRDLTDSHNLERKMLKFSQLESIGLLAGGIAHDFNNLLTGILGDITLAKTAMDSTEESFQRLTEAENASVHAKHLTRQLLTLAKGGAPVKHLTSISEVLVESVTFALCGSKVRCEWSIPEDLWPTKVDTGQISQVVQNLVINAEQSMPYGGVITIHCENIPARQTPPLQLPERAYIKITIVDQGVGISAECLDRIFDPYFTTKDHGSGLGLATSHAIIKRHEGAIMVDSRLGEGTTFEVYLPASPHTAPQASPGRKTAYDETPERGTGRILIMDDEVIIQELVGRMLNNAGYEVDFANDGAAAMQVYRKAQAENRPFDAVIMDLTIPGGMGGKEAIKKLLSIDPHARGIVSSGYPNDPVMIDFKKYGFKNFVAKPYKFKELHTALQQVLLAS